MAEQKVIEQIAELSIPAKKAGRPKRTAVGIAVPIQQICRDCEEPYTANKVTFDDGSTLITPPRCTICQTAHVTNGRVNKVLTGFKHLGNIKARLTSKQREAIINVLANEIKVLCDVYAGNSISVSGFNLKDVK